MARRPCDRCIQVITHGGLSEMQKAEADMARDKGVPVIKLHLDGNVEYWLADCMPSSLKVLAAAMKVAPEAVKRAEEAGSARQLPAGHDWKPVDVREELE